jgi:molybdopterin synthase catalytic subunit
MTMIEVTEQSISPETVINRVKSDGSGCVVTYVGLIRDNSRGKPVVSVEYRDPKAVAGDRLREITDAAGEKWPINDIAVTHRLGKLVVGDINLVVAVAAAHRKEGFAACQYVIDQFKQRFPTAKRETYRDGSVWTGE